jgi:hypothetical protein
MEHTSTEKDNKSVVLSLLDSDNTSTSDYIVDNIVYNGSNEGDNSSSSSLSSVS